MPSKRIDVIYEANINVKNLTAQKVSMNLILVTIINLFLLGSIQAQEISFGDFISKWSGSFEKVDKKNEFVSDTYKAKVHESDKPLYIEKVFSSPISLNRKFTRVRFKISNLKAISGMELRLSSDESGYNNFFAIPIPIFTDIDFNTVQTNSWMTYTFTMGEANITGDPDIDNIKRLGFYIGGQKLEVEFSSIELVDSFAQSIVSFTFDDGYDEHFLAAEIMGAYGFPGTAYLMPRQINKKNYLTTDNIIKMREQYGWDLASHHKIPIIDFEYSELDNEFNYTIGYLNALGSEEEALHFAYPLGKQNRQSTLPLVTRTFSSARLAGGGAETLPPANWHMLRTLNVQPSMSPQDLITRIRTAEQQGEWLILMFHYLTDDQNPTDTLSYNTEKFKEFCKLLYAEGTFVATVNQVYQAFEQ